MYYRIVPHEWYRNMNCGSRHLKCMDYLHTELRLCSAFHLSVIFWVTFNKVLFAKTILEYIMMPACAIPVHVFVVMSLENAVHNYCYHCQNLWECYVFRVSSTVVYKGTSQKNAVVSVILQVGRNRMESILTFLLISVISTFIVIMCVETVF